MEDGREIFSAINGGLCTFVCLCVLLLMLLVGKRTTGHALCYTRRLWGDFTDLYTCILPPTFSSSSSLYLICTIPWLPSLILGEFTHPQLWSESEYVCVCSRGYVRIQTLPWMKRSVSAHTCCIFWTSLLVCWDWWHFHQILVRRRAHNTAKYDQLHPVTYKRLPHCLLTEREPAMSRFTR